jgi:hypothetical protein
MENGTSVDVNIHRQTGSEHDTVCVFSTIQKDSSSNVDNQQQTRDECGTSVLQSNVSTNSSDDVGLYDRKRIHTGMGVGSQLCFDRCFINSSYPKLKSNRISFIRRLFVAGDNSGIMGSKLCSGSVSFASRVFADRDYSLTLATSYDASSVSFASWMLSDSWLPTITPSDKYNTLDESGNMHATVQDIQDMETVHPAD